MKIQHYVAVVFSYLLFLVMAVVACSELSKGVTLLRSGSSAWEGRSQIVAGLLSLGLAYFLWRWAGSVKENAQISLQLRKRLDAE
jgi:membrane protease YdiL (CAAX protease family)